MAEIKDTMQKIAGSQNPLEELLLKIPGFKGYLEKEARRESDKIHRTYLSQKLNDTKKHINEVKNELIDEGKLFHLEKLDRISDKIDGAVSRIKYADRGYSGFFDAIKMDDEALQTLHQLDLALVEQVTGVEEAVKKLSADADDDEIKQALKDITRAVEAFNDKFKERDHVVSGVI